jgi:apurinic endonuclease APN1
MSISFYSLSINGTHTSLQASFLETVKTANEKGYYNIQIFLGSPYSLNRRQFTKSDIDDTKKYLSRNNIKVFTHLPYIINLAGSSKHNELCWNGNKEIDNYALQCIKCIEYECNTLGLIQNKEIGGCVLHIGSIGKLGDSASHRASSTNGAKGDSAKAQKQSDKSDREKGLNSVVQSINKINFKENDCKLILETMVGRGGVLGVSFEELSYIYNRIEESKRKHIGICIDTCHIFAEGLYKLDSVKEVDKVFEDFQKYFTIDKLSVIHLNDSKCEYNSKADRHSTLMNGCIWKRDVLKYFVSICETYNIPMILETEETDYDVVENL